MTLIFFVWAGKINVEVNKYVQHFILYIYLVYNIYITVH